jgi:hypothetical protein
MCRVAKIAIKRAARLPISHECMVTKLQLLIKVKQVERYMKNPPTSCLIALSNGDPKKKKKTKILFYSYLFTAQRG